MEKKLKPTWIAGIVWFTVTIPEIIFNLARYYDDLPNSDYPAYIIISIISLITYTFFMYGFIVIGKNLKNNLIVIASYLFILCTVAEYGIDFISLGNNSEEQKAIAAIFSVFYGFIGIFFGIGLFRLENVFGNLAKYAGILEIIAGITFAVIFLFFIGLFLIFPITILEIIILYKAANKIDWLEENAAVA